MNETAAKVNRRPCPVITSEYYSAILRYRWYKPIFGSHLAYWITLAAHGWPDTRKLARDRVEHAARTAEIQHNALRYALEQP